MSIKTVKPYEVENLINSVRKGEIFSLVFERVAPKCKTCNKSKKSWRGLTHCPDCHTALSFERETLAQRGIENPANPADKPNGNGESAVEAAENGRLKYYDMNATNPHNAIKGGYRQCYIANIKRLTMRGVTYEVEA